MPTRRAWLLAGGAFLAGAVSGACGATLVIGGREPEALDPKHQWLRDLCDDGTPMADLIQHRVSLFLHLPKWRDDMLLWHGIERLGAAALSNQQVPASLAQELVALLDRCTPPAGSSIDVDVAALRDAAEKR